MTLTGAVVLPDRFRPPGKCDIPTGGHGTTDRSAWRRGGDVSKHVPWLY